MAENMLDLLSEKINQLTQNRITFSRFLEEKMDEFDYSNTTLAKKVLHKTENKKTGEISYVPVTRQAIAAWLKGTMPGSREVYVSLGMAFDMEINEINREILEVFMGYGLYCKNTEDAIYIAVINGIFPLEEMETVKENIEMILQAEEEPDQNGRILTTDLWRDLEHAGTKEEFYSIIKANREEFLDGTRQFGKCLNEVIEEEYGYYEKSTEFLSNIGCLHCEAQFSKIKAGKAVVTREWLLRFCLAMQPSYSSIEKLLKKAQMEPLGITPAEIVIDWVAKTKSESANNSQEIWISIEQMCEDLIDAGFSIDEDLGRKYNLAYRLPIEQKIWFGILIGWNLLEAQKQKNFGYYKDEYVRYQYVDHLLFEETNRLKKSLVFKKKAKEWAEGTKNQAEDKSAYIEMEKLEKPIKDVDEFHLEKFNDYCYMEKPKRKSNDYYMNDIYFYSGVLYSLFSGKCFIKDFDERQEQNIRKALDGIETESLMEMFYNNLGPEIEAKNMVKIKDMVAILLDLSKSL